MGTIVTIQVGDATAEVALDRAFGWFHEIEERCSRFRAQGELTQLTARVGEPVPVSPILFEAIRFALLVAEESGGAFDPTAGRHHPADDGASYRDILIDPEHSAITLRRPLTLDLGAVAKGLAVDMAARELQPFRDFAIDAGGDLYLGGSNPRGELWSVGIRHPRCDSELIDSVRVSDRAVCTSGDYERGDHIVDPRIGVSAATGVLPKTAASATVIASGAMLADALATAAFVLGPVEGIGFLERMGVDGLIVTPSLERFETRGFHEMA